MNNKQVACSLRRVNMANRNALPMESETQDSSELFSESEFSAGKSLESKSRQTLNAIRKGQVRRSIEEIQERRQLKELFGDDYNELDYLDS